MIFILARVGRIFQFIFKTFLSQISISALNYNMIILL